MSPAEQEYRRLLAELVAGRKSGRFKTVNDEDAIIEALDDRWYDLSRDEQRRIADDVRADVRREREEGQP